MNTSNETTERGGFFRRLFGPSKAKILTKLEQTITLAEDLQIEIGKERDRAAALAQRARNEMERAESIEQLCKELRAQRNISWPKPAVRMPEKLVLAEFNVPIDQGYPAAVLQELDDKIQELLDLVTQPPHGEFHKKDGSTVPAFTEADRLHLAGGVEHLRLFQKQMLDLSARANTVDADLETDEKQEA